MKKRLTNNNRHYENVLRENTRRILNVDVISEGPYKDVRALARGLNVLETLSELGWTRIGTLASHVDIDRSSLYRIVSTLVGLGYVVRRQEDGAITLTARLAHIADGVKDDDIIAQTVAPYLRELTHDLLWPSDFASFIRGAVIIRCSTHKFSPMSIHRRVVGKKRLLVRSALGQAILSAMTSQELEASLAIVESQGGPDAKDIINRTSLAQTLNATRDAGYASSSGQMEANISAIALPVHGPSGVVGAINIVFFRSAMTTTRAAERHLERLRSCIRDVETAIANLSG
ncbi:IclR family transcriptional regulator domain-containing protein [Agrobacterium radiobacter]|uniref:IclR family transcriptional regulator domain-containing protein n=1 Tax=Agrobacterium radiobacter TaxID=362 RepID=UPI003F8682ED